MTALDIALINKSARDELTTLQKNMDAKFEEVESTIRGTQKVLSDILRELNNSVKQQNMLISNWDKKHSNTIIG